MRNYPQIKSELEEWRNNILYSSPQPPDGMPRSNGVSNPTLQKVDKLTTNRRIKCLEQIIGAIETVLNRLDDDKLQLIKLRYWQTSRKLTNVGIAMELHVDKRTVERWVNVICFAIALELGMVKKGD